MFWLSIAGAAAVSATLASAQTWCGKNYMASQPIVPPGGQFPVPATSSAPLLAFRCAPAIRPYIPEDAHTPASFIIDTVLTDEEVVGAKPISLAERVGKGENVEVTVSVNGKKLASGENVEVTVSVNGKKLASGSVPLNATKHEIPFSLASLKPQAEPFDVSCTAKVSSAHNVQTFAASTKLSFLPDPPAGRSVTKMDLRTGGLLARPATGKPGPFETVLPIGFYTGFGNYLASNLSVIDELKEQGFTVVHPIPTFDNLTALDLVLDRMQEVGLYLMYDMRWTYMNSTAVTEEVNRIKNRPNLLLWYTADEPDGTSDPFNATTNAYDLIYSLDGYHPVSLVLNCENFHFPEYTAGTDIVMQDTYMISNNVTFSVEWHTPCTEDFGDCGCDNCHGNFTDISHRMDAFAARLFALDWANTKAVWTVPQAFGGDGEYWARAPTGKEYVVQSVVALNHGAKGSVAWDDPTPVDIKESASALAKALTQLKDFILSPKATFRGVVQNGVDVGLWTVGKQTLVLATNMAYAEAKLGLKGLGVGRIARQVFDSGAKVQGDELVFESVGSGAFIVS